MLVHDQHPGVLAPGWNEDVVKNLPVLLGIFNRFKASAEKNKYKMLTINKAKTNKKVSFSSVVPVVINHHENQIQNVHVSSIQKTK